MLQDAYVALFATLMLGAMLANVVLQSRRVLAGACTTSGCTEARALLPWLVVLATLLSVLGVARLFGPVFASPASVTWLVGAPLDRGALLRPRLGAALGLAALVTAPLALAAAALAGFGTGALVVDVLAATAVAIALVGAGSAVAVRAGPGHDRAWCACSASAPGWGWCCWPWAGCRGSPRRSARPRVRPWPGWGCSRCSHWRWAPCRYAGSGGCADNRLSSGGSLAPGLSGALASLDLALVYDVLVAHRWRGQGAVRSRRGGPGGVWALVFLDLVRLRRTPSRVVVLLAAVAVPYAAAAAGAGRVSLLLGALAGFLAGLPFLVALRVVTRTPSIARALPVSDPASRGATVVVAGLLLALFGLATTGAVRETLPLPTLEALQLGLAVGGAGLAGAVRWVTGRPPDYTRPLVSTPAGGVPTNLYSSVVRGFDMVLLCTAPVLLAPTGVGALVSLGLSAVVVSVLLGRR